MEQEYRKLSYWHDSAPGSLEPRPSLENDVEADIVIVGAGFTGLWTAYYLKQIDPSLDITILEALRNWQLTPKHTAVLFGSVSPGTPMPSPD